MNIEKIRQTKFVAVKKIFKFFVLLCTIFILILPTVSYAKDSTTPSGIPTSNLEQFVDNYINHYIGKTVAGASIILIKDNKIVLSKGYGYADIENKIPMNPDKTVMEWGSTSKLFVWTAVIQLVEQGKINLNENIKDYLPNDFLTKLKYKEPITMLDLMNHTAGFEDNVFDLGFSSPKQVKSLEEGLRIAEPAQVYKPGTVVSYSNYGAALAAYIVQRVSGEPFYNYVNENIFSKLGMRNSVEQPALAYKNNVVPNKAKGYELIKPSDFKDSTPWYMSMYPCGGIYGTATDLAKYALSLMPNNNEFSPLFKNNTTLNQMLSQSFTGNKKTVGIAHGFWGFDGKYMGYSHSGNTASFSSNFVVVPNEKFAVIVLTNQAAESDLTYGLTKALLGNSNMTSTSIKLPNSKIVEGTYLPARRPYSNFLKAYFYLIPLKVSSVNKNEIQVNVNGMKAKYVQTSPYLYKMIKGDGSLRFNDELYFHIKNNKVAQISASYSDYLPFSKQLSVLVFMAVIFIVCVLYYIFFPFFLVIKKFTNRKSKSSVSLLGKWLMVLNSSGTLLIINLITLAYRMLSNSNRAYSEISTHIILNYIFTFINAVSIGCIIFYFRKVSLTKMQKIGSVLSIVFSTSLMILLFIWKFY